MRIELIVRGGEALSSLLWPRAHKQSRSRKRFSTIRIVALILGIAMVTPVEVASTNYVVGIKWTGSRITRRA